MQVVESTYKWFQLPTYVPYKHYVNNIDPNCASHTQKHYVSYWLYCDCDPGEVQMGGELANGTEVTGDIEEFLANYSLVTDQREKFY